MNKEERFLGYEGENPTVVEVPVSSRVLLLLCRNVVKFHVKLSIFELLGMLPEIFAAGVFASFSTSITCSSSFSTESMAYLRRAFPVFCFNAIYLSGNPETDQVTKISKSESRFYRNSKTLQAESKLRICFFQGAAFQFILHLVFVSPAL